MSPRVLITGRHAWPLSDLLAQRGLLPVHVPLIALRPTGQAPPRSPPDHVLITSPAVAGLVPDLASAIAGAQVHSVGHKTTLSLNALGVDVAHTGSSTGAALVRAIAPRVSAQDVVWHIGAVTLSPAIHAAFEAWGHPVLRWVVYENHEPDGLDGALSRVLPVDAVIFSSGSTARAFAAHASLGGARVVAIGQPTAQVCAELGLPVHHVAPEPTMEALAQGALTVLRAAGSGPW